MRLSMVSCTCNFSTLGGQGKRIAGGQEFETSLGNTGRPCLKKKGKKKKEEEKRKGGEGGHGCVPIKFYLQKQATSHLGP